MMKQFKDISVILLATATMTLGMNTAFADDASKTTSQQVSKAQDPDHMKKIEKKVEKKLEKMKKDLSLSDEQVKKIREIMKASFIKMDAEFKAMHEKMAKMHDATANDIKALLDDKQKASFDEKRAEQKAKRDKEMKDKQDD